MLTHELLAQASELHWLSATVLMTALFWMPYVLNRIAEHGLMGALRNPTTESAARADWARRMQAAHTNAVENLVLFAPLVVVSVLFHGSQPGVVAASALYFHARLAHFVVYSLGVAFLRTLAFAAGWAACIYIGLSIFGLVA